MDLRKYKKPLTAGLLALTAGLVVLIACQARSGLQAGLAADGALAASGVIQAETVDVASERGGLIAALAVEQGDAVSRGDVLVQLDTAVLDAQISGARATLAVAEAQLAQAQADARPGQIAVAEAQLAQAQAAHVAARQAVSDTQALLENPQDILLQIAVTQAQLQAARHDVAQATALKDAAEVGKQALEDAQAQWIDGQRYQILVSSGDVDDLPGIVPSEIADLLPNLADGVHTFGDLELHLHDGTYELYKWIAVSYPLEAQLLPNTWWQAWVGVNAASAQEAGVEATLASLYAQQANPQRIETQADQALAALAQSEAQIAAAEAQVAGLTAGATAEQLALLQARVGQAQAALDALLSQRSTMTVTAALDGVVVDLAMYQGEVAAAGATMLSLADLDEVTLVVYVPETRIGQVQVGQAVQVSVDSFPGRTFEGTVGHIADTAEFTPRNVATQEERVNLVFAVEIRLPNTDGALKPGMPADVVFEGDA